MSKVQFIELVNRYIAVLYVNVFEHIRVEHNLIKPEKVKSQIFLQKLLVRDSSFKVPL